MYGCVYTFGQYRHLTTGGYPKKACPQQLLQTVNERDKYNILSFRRIKVIQHCKNTRMSIAYIFLT